MDHHTQEHLHESPKVVTVPLIMLAIPSVIIGAIYVGPMLFHGYFAEAIPVRPEHDVLGEIGRDYHGWWSFLLHGLGSAPFMLAMLGVATAWVCYIHRPELPAMVVDRFKQIYTLLINKYGFDDFNDRFFAGGARSTGQMLWQVGDVTVIDGLLVNGSARAVGWFSGIARQLQSGYLYHYAFAMIIGLLAFIALFVY